MKIIFLAVYGVAYIMHCHMKY